MSTQSDRAIRAEQRSTPEWRCVREMDPNKRIAQQFEMREVPNGTGGSKLKFTGYASVVDTPYEVSDILGPYTETIARGAFNKSINDGADVAFLVNHGAGGGVTMARTKAGTLQLSSDATGLHSEASLNPGRPDVQVVRHAVADGDLDEMSFAFRVTRQEWNKDYTERHIQEVNLHQGDVSIVNFGANGATAGLLDLRGRQLTSTNRRKRRVELPDHLTEAEALLRQERLRHPKDPDAWYRIEQRKLEAVRSK